MADYIPLLGDHLKTEDIEMIVDAIDTRAANFPDEPKELTLALVLTNIGNRFTPLKCVGGEWTGLIKDIPRSQDSPTCPDGHALIKGEGIKLGWLPSE